MIKAIDASPYVLDDPEKVHQLGSQLGGRRLREGIEPGELEVWKFPSRKQMWAFTNVLNALDENSCICAMAESSSEQQVKLEYVEQIGR